MLIKAVPTITKDLLPKLQIFDRVNEILRENGKLDDFEYRIGVGLLSVEPDKIPYIKPRAIKVSKEGTNRLTGIPMPPSIEMEVYISSEHLAEADDARFVHIIMNAIKNEMDHAVQNNKNLLIVEGMKRGSRIMEQVLKKLSH